MAIPKIISQVQSFANTNTPRVLYLGTPSYDRTDIFNIQTKGFQNANCQITKMDLSEIPDSSTTGSEVTYPTKQEMREQVGNADVVMVSGGNTLYAMKRWEELGMAEILKEAALKEKGPIFCGGSAGAIAWFEFGNSDSMNPMTFLNPDPNLSEEEKKAWDYIRISGLGIIKALCVPHFDVLQHNGLLRSKASEGMVKEMSGYPCIGIDEEAAFVVDGDIVNVVQGGEDAKVYRKIFNSKTMELEIMALEEEHGPYSLSGLGLV